MEKEIKNNENAFTKPWVISLFSFLIIFGLLFLFLFWQVDRTRVYVENSYLDAPIVNISPIQAGSLNALYVKEGDMVEANSEVALVGSGIIYAKEKGVVVSAPSLIGAYFLPGQTILSIVKNNEMKVVGAIEETKGLKDIKIGERATFTVDAFPDKNYEGVVSDISPVSIDNGVIFSISDKRPVKKFNLKIAFNSSLYPELKSGMSAKITVYIR